MAESGEEEMAASWWGGWLQTAKEKSMAALDIVRKDLTEFGTTMQSDAGHVVELTSSTLKESLKTENTSAAKEKLTKGLNTVLERLSQALVVPPDDEGQIPITSSSTELYDRTKARIQTIQVDPATYTEEPSGPRETYSMWCEGFDLDACKGQVSELLVARAEVRALYTKLVPSQVSHVDFWRRYFYKLHQVDVEQARKEALMKRADSVGAEDSISWDDDWSGDEAAAEDSGSDWEKLPRPGHHRRSPSPSPSNSPGRESSSALSEQSKDFQSVALCTPQPSHADEASEAGGGRRAEEERNQEEEETELLQVTKAVGESPVVMSPLEETPTPVGVPPCQQQTTTDNPESQQSTDTFKDYLQLAADNENAVENVSEEASPSQSETEETEVISDVEKCQSSKGESETHDLPSLTPTPLAQTSSSEVVLGSISLEEKEATQPSASLSGDEQQSFSIAEEMKTIEKGREEVKEVLNIAVEEGGPSLTTTERGDLVVVGSDHGSPVSNTSGSKVLSDVDDEWEQDLDIELTEEDMKEAEDLARKLGDNLSLVEDDWESWE